MLDRQRDFGRPEKLRYEQRTAPQRADKTRINEEQVGASDSEDEDSNDRSDAGTLSPSASRTPSSDNNQLSGNLPVRTTQSSVVEESPKAPAGRTTSPRRIAACKAKSRLSSGKGKLYSPRTRKRRTRGTTDAENLDTIVSKLGCMEVQSAIREAISSNREARFNSNSLMRSYSQEDPTASRISLFAGFVQSLEKHPSTQWLNAVKYRLDVAFFSRFYLSVNQKESDPHHNRGLSAFLEGSLALLQLHDRRPTKKTPKGRGKASLVRDRLTDFILLDGRPDTEDTRQSIRSTATKRGPHTANAS